MARRRFSRPRRASNLTSLIAQLLREQRAAEDRAIFDAYRNGGQFQGKPVDDARILAYITSRRDSFATNDPLYDEWNNTLIQTSFSIGEQKIGLAFKEGRASASQVAAFYRNQLQSLTPNSEFYRDVAGRAAEWAKSASASARAAAGSRLRAQLDTAEKDAAGVIAAFQSIDGILERAAREAGIIAGNQDLTDANATALFALLDRGVMGADGTPITYSEWQAAAVASWQAQGTVIDLRKQAGAAYVELQNQREKFMSNYLVRLNAADDRQKYEAARETWLVAIGESKGDPQSVLDANAKYAQALTAIRDGAASAQNDPDFIGGLNNELAAIGGKEPTGPTVADLYGASFTGQPGGAVPAGTESDARATYQDTVRAMADVAKLESGAAYLGQAEPGGPLQVIPYPAGGATDPFGRNGLDQSVQPSIERINGKQRLVFLQGEPIRAASYMAANGAPVPPEQVSQQAILRGDITLNTSDAPVIGYSFVGPTGSQSFGVFQADGSLLFTTSNPFVGSGIAAEGQTFVVTNAVRTGDRFTPDTSGLVRPMSLNPTAGELGATLLATGATVSSTDMLRLIDSGALINVKPEDRQAIADRSRRDLATVASRRREQFGEPVGARTGPVDQESRRVLPGGLLDTLDVVRREVAQEVAPPPRKTLLGPPPPPPPPPTPPPTPVSPSPIAPKTAGPRKTLTAPSSASSPPPPRPGATNPYERTPV